MRLVFSLLIVSAILNSKAEAEEMSLQRFMRTERHMGADFSVTLYAADSEKAETGFKAVFAIAAEIDRTMSDYNSESELSRLSQSSPTKENVRVSNDLFAVLKLADSFSQQTDGAFDVTVGPLTKLWRRAKRQRELPERDDLSAALASVGWRNVVLDEANQSIGLSKPKMRLDLGGIAPGYAADKGMQALRDLGIPQALVDASGDVAIGEPPPSEIGWKIGVAGLDPETKPKFFLRLSNCAISTSGDAYRGVEIGGVRYSHIVDPKTGLGVQHRTAVTVIGPDCTTVDALATAFSVAGLEDAKKLLPKFKGCEAQIISQTTSGETTLWQSQHFTAHNEVPK